MARAHRAVARIAKVHGNKGKVVAVPADGLPFVLEEGMRVAIVPPELKGSRWHVVSSVEDGPQGQLVGFEDVTGREQAEPLHGKTILVSVDDLPEDFAAHDAPRLIGRAVADEALGWQGTIAEVMLGPANDVWVLEGTDGTEVLVPVVPAVVEEVPAEGPIALHIPAGLVEDAGGAS